ncbi:MAG: hypothetical protein HKN82_06865 [Akkermansiaceae bacterium]|nr:hypothetical protein [Akkermansiaceae bacterium]NNM29571.1 hypothetical protein [Akkermansiaceae bacterium]
MRFDRDEDGVLAGSELQEFNRYLGATHDLDKDFTLSAEEMARLRKTLSAVRRGK